MKKGVLVSDDGAKLESVYRNGVSIGLVIADRECPALHRAQGYRIKRELVLCRDSTGASEECRLVYTRQLIGVLKMYGIETVILAGFKTQLAPVFYERYADRVISWDDPRPAAIKDYLTRLGQGAPQAAE